MYSKKCVCTGEVVETHRIPKGIKAVVSAPSGWGTMAGRSGAVPSSPSQAGSMGCSFYCVDVLSSAHLEKVFTVAHSEGCRHNQTTKLNYTRQSRRKTWLPLKNELCSGSPNGQGKKGNVMGSQFLLRIKMAQVLVFCKHAL